MNLGRPVNDRYGYDAPEPIRQDMSAFVRHSLDDRIRLTPLSPGGVIHGKRDAAGTSASQTGRV